MMVSIHQPSYWPWLGLLDKIAKTDTFILLDDVQVSKGSYQYRNIFYSNGKAVFISLPVSLNLGMTFNDLEFRNNNWKAEHLNKLYNYYLKSQYFNEVYPELEKLYSGNFNKPVDFLKATMIFCIKKLGISVEFFLSSQFEVPGTKGEKVLNLCKAAGATEYLAGRGSFEYMQKYLPVFSENNIQVKWHSFKHPVYKQFPPIPFIEGLAGLDIFFFMGFEGSQRIFLKNINDTNSPVF
jgi:hypothetical protein